MWNRLSFFVALFMISLSTIAEAKLFDMDEFVLENGMRVIVIPNHKAPIVKHMVWYGVGSVEEPIGQGGTAHLLEHLMFRGTEKIKNSDLNTILEENGAESNAFTAQDVTSYHQMLDITKLELAMFLEADRMKNLALNEENFSLERDIVYQERKQVVENNPSAVFGEALRKTLWQNHPYARSITGEEEEIKNLEIGDVQRFYDAYYAPNNAILVLSGDIDAKTAKILTNKYYGVLPKKDLGKKTEFPKLSQEMRAKIEMSLPKIALPRISRSYIAPSYNFEKEEIYNLAVLSRYLGEGETSKLYKKLVLEKKLAANVSTNYDFISRSYGSFSISAVPMEGVSPQELNSAIDVAIGVALEELNFDEAQKIKHKMLAGIIYLKDNPSDAAYIVGAMAVVGMPMEEIENYAENIKAVDYKNVQKSAKKLFEKTAYVTGILTPMEKK